MAICTVVKNPEAGLLRSHEERQLFADFKTPKRRQEFLAGRQAAYQAIAQLLPAGSSLPAVIPGIMGQPTLVGSENLELSITHTFPCAIAFACEPGFPLTIDLERTDGSRQAALAEVLTDSEKSLFPEHAIAFSAKEAMGKFLRCGFQASWQIFEISGCTKIDEGYEITFAHFSGIRVISHRIGNFVLSLALPGEMNVNTDLQLLAQTLENQ